MSEMASGQFLKIDTSSDMEDGELNLSSLPDLLSKVHYFYTQGHS